MITMRTALLAAALAASLINTAAAQQQQQAPYSCRLYWDEQQKHAYGAQNERELERLRIECIRDGGHP